MKLFHDCRVRMHGLIYDGRLWACQSCLLGLMYVLRLLYAIRCFRVMVFLGFQLVGDCIKGQALPFFNQFLQNFFIKEGFFHSQIEFLDVHDDYYTTTVYIHYVFFPSLQSNFRKTNFCHLMLKAVNFFLFFFGGFLGFFCCQCCCCYFSFHVFLLWLQYKCKKKRRTNSSVNAVFSSTTGAALIVTLAIPFPAMALEGRRKRL